MQCKASIVFWDYNAMQSDHTPLRLQCTLLLDCKTHCRAGQLVWWIFRKLWERWAGKERGVANIWSHILPRWWWWWLRMIVIVMMMMKKKNVVNCCAVWWSLHTTSFWPAITLLNGYYIVTILSMVVIFPTSWDTIFYARTKWSTLLCTTKYIFFPSEVCFPSQVIFALVPDWALF